MNAEIVVSIAGLIVVVYGAIIYDIYQKMDLKQDKSMCEEIKSTIKTDLARGDKRFDELIEELKILSKRMAEISTNLALTIQRLQAIEDRLPQLERRKDEAVFSR